MVAWQVLVMGGCRKRMLIIGMWPSFFRGVSLPLTQSPPVYCVSTRFAETEPSALVGQYVPSDRKTAAAGDVDPIVWVDGVVTSAFKEGSWICVDGLGEAEAAVLERLNPILESPPTWVLTEQGSSQPLPCPPSFRFMATMTPPSKYGKSDIGVLSAELSPAMNNRLSLLVLEDPTEGTDAAFKDEMQQLAAALSVDDCADHSKAAAAAECCCCIRRWVQQYQGLSSSDGWMAPVTLRGYVGMLDNAYTLQVHYSLEFSEALLSAFDLNLRGQLKDVGEEAVQELRHQLANLLGVSVHMTCLQMLANVYQVTPVHNGTNIVKQRGPLFRPR